MDIQQQDCDACGESFLSYGKATRCEICKAQKPDNLTAAAIVLVGEHLIRCMWAINATLAADGNNLKANMQSVIDSAEAECSGFRAAAEKMGIKIYLKEQNEKA